MAPLSLRWIAVLLAMQGSSTATTERLGPAPTAWLMPVTPTIAYYSGCATHAVAIPLQDSPCLDCNMYSWTRCHCEVDRMIP